MAEHPNEALVRRGYQAFETGDMDTMGKLMTPDVVHRVPGNNQTSGEHKGQDEVFAMYNQLFELTGGNLSVELESVEAQGDDRVVAVHRLRGEREGKTLDVRETIEFTISGDTISRLDETTEDEAAEDAFWG
jgi:ketosteroid isomerase-like protein